MSNTQLNALDQLPTATSVADRHTTRALLAAGAMAGPLFMVTASAQGLVRDGFDISRHPFSALSIGDYGWVQVANFIATGLLVIAAAAGLRRVLPTNGGVRWGTNLLAAHGVGLVGAGIFVTDAADGFPVGTPEGLPDSYSWHAIVHGVVTPLAFLAVLASCVVLSVPLTLCYGRGWRRASRFVPVGVALVMATPGIGGVSLRLAVATALVLGWLLGVCGRAAAGVGGSSGRVDLTAARSA